MPAEDKKVAVAGLGKSPGLPQANNWPASWKAVDADWNELSDTSDQAAVNAYWQFPRPAGDGAGMAQAGSPHRLASARTASRDACP